MEAPKRKETKVVCQNKFGSVLNNVYKYSLSQDSLEPLTCYQVLGISKMMMLYA